jgi:hypothetical protein
MNWHAVFDTVGRVVAYVIFGAMLCQAWSRALRLADAAIDWIKASSAKKLAEGRRALREGGR